MSNDIDILNDEAVDELREDWHPKQYDSWPEPQRTVMKKIAEKFYGMSTEEYREVLKNTDDGT